MEWSKHRSSADSGKLSSWNDHLNPRISKSNWTKQDTLRLLELQNNHNSKWSIIASDFSHRSPTFLKNTFFLTLRKVLRKIAKYSSVPISSVDLKSLQPRVLTEFIWSEFSPSELGLSDGAVDKVRMIDLFKWIISGECQNIDKMTKFISRTAIDRLFALLTKMK